MRTATTRATSAVGLLTLTLLASAGCQDPTSSPVHTSAVEVDAARLTVHPVEPCDDVTAIEYELTRDVTDGPDETLGSWVLDSEQPRTVDSFTYGDVPSGFTVGERTRTDWRDADYVVLSVTTGDDEANRTVEVPDLLDALPDHPGEWYVGDTATRPGEETSDDDAWVDPDAVADLLDPDQGIVALCD